MSAARARLLLFDATRLAGRIDRASPTGIDRVDLAYLQALGQLPGFEQRLLIGGAHAPQLLSQAASEALLDLARRRWQNPQAPSTAAFGPLRRWLQSDGGAAPRIRSETQDTQPLTRRLRTALGHVPGVLRLQRQLAGLDRPAIYINTSHGRLFRPAATRWMQAAPVHGVFFVHDLIPLEFPQYNRPAEPARHAARLAVIAARARLVVTNSHATTHALLRWWKQQGLHAPPVQTLPLGLAPDFMAHAGSATPAIARPYFVVLGTLEPRKNHALLLDIWDRLIADHGDAAPRLLLVGRRGWQNQALFDRLERSPALAAHVAECAGLSDAEVAVVLRGARALLSPSFAEGYGLPVAEALALGVPVIASDLVAHREVGGDTAEYLAATDGAAWSEAIAAYRAPDSPRRDAALVRLTHYRAPSWTVHFSALGDLLHQLDGPA